MDSCLFVIAQISTLVSLKLLTHTGSSAMFQGVPKYRCNASYDLVKSLARLFQSTFCTLLRDSIINYYYCLQDGQL